jgi:hypothetical protein
MLGRWPLLGTEGTCWLRSPPDLSPAFIYNVGFAHLAKRSGLNGGFLAKYLSQLRPFGGVLQRTPDEKGTESLFVRMKIQSM